MECESGPWARKGCQIAAKWLLEQVPHPTASPEIRRRFTRISKLSLGIGVVASGAFATSVSADKLTSPTICVPKTCRPVLPNVEATSASRQSIEKWIVSKTTPPNTILKQSPSTATHPQPSAVTRLHNNLLASELHMALSLVPYSKGADLSWPESNCAKDIPNDVQYVVLGVTGGKDFTKNNCLSTEIQKANNAHLPIEMYVNSDYQSGPAMQTYQDNRIPKVKTCTISDLNCIAFDYGYNAGQDAAKYAHKSGVIAPIFWLDVETGNSWDGNKPGHDISENRQSLLGEMTGIEDYIKQTTNNTVEIGFYSVPQTMWVDLTGSWHPPDARDPSNPKLHARGWVAKAFGSEAEARAACQGNDFTGGGVEIVQYQTDPTLDRDVNCH